MNLLLIDEDKSFLNYINGELTRKVLFVKTAECASKAMKILSLGGVDLIFSSVTLPDMDVVSLTCNIKRSYPKIPLILFSNSEPDFKVKTALMFGADALIPKLADANLLYSVITRFVVLKLVAEFN